MKRAREAGAAFEDMGREAAVDTLKDVFMSKTLLDSAHAREKLGRDDIEAIRTLAAKMAAEQIAKPDGGASTLVRVAHEMVLGPVDLLMKRLTVYTKFWSGMSPLIVEDWPHAHSVLEYDPSERDKTEENATALLAFYYSVEKARDDRMNIESVEKQRIAYREHSCVIQSLYAELYDAFKKSGYADALGDMSESDFFESTLWHGPDSIARRVPRAAWLLYAEFTGVPVTGLVVSRPGHSGLPVRTLHGAWFLAAHKTSNDGRSSYSLSIPRAETDATGDTHTGLETMQLATISPAFLLQQTAWMVASALLADADLSHVNMLPRKLKPRDGTLKPSPPPSFWLQLTQMVVQLKFGMRNRDPFNLWRTSRASTRDVHSDPAYSIKAAPLAKTATLVNLKGASNPIGRAFACYWMQYTDVPAAAAAVQLPVYRHLSLSDTFRGLLAEIQKQRDTLFDGGDDNPDFSAKAVRMKFDTELLNELVDFLA